MLQFYFKCKLFNYQRLKNYKTILTKLKKQTKNNRNNRCLYLLEIGIPVASSPGA